MTDNFETLESAREKYKNLEAKTLANLREIEKNETREEQLLKRITEQMQSICQLIQELKSDA
jgi:uncharacterized membrane protein YccC